MIFGAARVAPEKAVFRPALPMSFMPGISEMRMATYFEKLKDPRWQKKRLEVLEAGNWTCVDCGDKDSTLHVHHRQYFKGREPWEYEVGQLEVLCEECHRTGHEAEGDDPLMLATSYVPALGRLSRYSVASLVAGYTGQPMNSPQVGDPCAYIAGEVAQVLEERCFVELMVKLKEALRTRNTSTVSASVEDFILDLKTRPDAPEQKRGVL